MDAAALPADDIVRAADGTPLKTKLRQAERRRNLQAFGLMAPLLAFIFVFFLFPIFTMLRQSVENFEVVYGLPRTVAALEEWEGTELPDETVFAALVQDLEEGYKAKRIPKVAVRLNYEIPLYRSMLLKTARRAGRFEPGPYKDALIKFDKRWGMTEYWAVLKRNNTPVTDHYFLTAVDLKRDARQDIVQKPENRRLYIRILFRTFWLSFLVTFFCLLLSYPVAYLLATQPTRISNLLMIFVLLPFWTSLLVRTVAWMVLLQEQGLLMDIMVWMGVLEERFRLIFNRPGLLIAMTHVLLPFMILPIYSVMKGIDPHYMRAAKSLGAPPAVAFLTVYVPLSYPGVGAGVLLVYILAVGYYITPELVGGPADQMISHFIAFYTNEVINWGQGAALAVILLAAVLLLFAVYNRFYRVGQV